MVGPGGGAGPPTVQQPKLGPHAPGYGPPAADQRPAGRHGQRRRTAGQDRGTLPARHGEDLPAQLLVALDYPLVTRQPRGLAVRATASCGSREQRSEVRGRRSEVRVGESPGAHRGAGSPGSLVLADGRRLTATAMRWTEHGLTTLTERGLTTVAFDGMADFRVPKPNVMAAVLDDDFYPPLGGKSTVVSFWKPSRGPC